MLNDARKEALVFASEHDITSFYHFGLLDKLETMSKRNMNIQLLTDYSLKSCFFVEKLKLKNARYSISTVGGLPTFILIDHEQLILLIRKNNGKKRVAALWTNYDAFC